MIVNHPDHDLFVGDGVADRREVADARRAGLKGEGVGIDLERPDQVATLIREALRHIPAERLIVSSDCGMGREGMSRRHAQYKMAAMVPGTNLVRSELGVREARCLAADQHYSLVSATG